ncbi:hypothetical protein HMPREF3036_01365 [Sutterella sp. KLE1602]|nr:hypothetical protein HMPREF3036_01365 [Sutterella sp. KLE1602]
MHHAATDVLILEPILRVWAARGSIIPDTSGAPAYSEPRTSSSASS